MPAEHCCITNSMHALVISLASGSFSYHAVHERHFRHKHWFWPRLMHSVDLSTLLDNGCQSEKDKLSKSE